MKPKILYDGNRPLFVLAENGKESDVERELQQFKSNRQTVRKAAALEVIMERFANGERLTAQMFHEAGETNGIKVMEFKKDPIRLYCVPIPDSRGALLLTHTVWKKWQKTRPQDLKQAVAELEKFTQGNPECLTN